MIRVIALWLMLVAVPFQGFAAASMQLCGVAMPAPQAGGHDHSAMTVQADSHHDCSSSAKCASMGDCCLGAALAYATPRAATAPQPGTRLRLAEPAPPAPVDLALPKRPPRAAFA
ncbi:hypothetical protein [Pseudoduganella sp.]|uniref:hypothetical protein n=1 Tax=Pseudoduganella sp. TaxID=1880898 RepID=UPI0035B2E284